MSDEVTGASLQWTAALSTGIASIDEQHRTLFDCLNLLEQAAAERSMLRTFYVLEQLSNYAHTHFSEEEFLMRVHEYPRVGDHMREHRSFTNRLHELRKIYLDRDISVELVTMLKDWLTHHVSKVDMDYVPYLVPSRRLEVPTARPRRNVGALVAQVASAASA
jgi:hemerythrin